MAKRHGVVKGVRASLDDPGRLEGGQRQGVTREKLPEIEALKAENRRLREHVDILRRATIFVAGELDPRNR